MYIRETTAAARRTIENALDYAFLKLDQAACLMIYWRTTSKTGSRGGFPIMMPRRSETGCGLFPTFSRILCWNTICKPDITTRGA